MIGWPWDWIARARQQRERQWDAKMQAAYDWGFYMQVIETHLKRKSDDAKRALASKPKLR